MVDRMAEAPRCAYCHAQPIEPRWRPFCSERCKMADLGRWLSGDYRIPDTSELPPGDETGADDEAADPLARDAERRR
jgi:endogenous inhibitor of DNA gyrase (YacG/DUF329 family)